MEAYENILVVIDENNFVTKAIYKAVNLIKRTHGQMSILLMEHHSRISRFSNLFSRNKQAKISNQRMKVLLDSIIKRLIRKGVKICLLSFLNTV